jgi:hypothetical protein
MGGATVRTFSFDTHQELSSQRCFQYHATRQGSNSSWWHLVQTNVSWQLFGCEEHPLPFCLHAARHMVHRAFKPSSEISITENRSCQTVDNGRIREIYSRAAGFLTCILWPFSSKLLDDPNGVESRVRKVEEWSVIRK